MNSQKNKPKKWTLIFLLSAKNNLYMEQLKVINEIYGVGSSKDVNLVIILDGLGGDKFSESLERPAVFYAQKNTDFLTDHHFHIFRNHNATLTDPKQLQRMLNIVVENFPATNYGFFYKGHGGPGEGDLARGMFVTRTAYVTPKIRDSQLEKMYGDRQRGWTFEGYCEYPAIKKSGKKKKPILLIYSKRNTKTLSYKQLASTLRNVFNGKLGFLCMDCCWAQQIENAYDFINVTDYFVASADEMPALGLGYTQLCSHFIKRPAIKPEEAANLIVAIYYNQNYADYDSEVAEFRKMGVSVTSVNLKEFDKFLRAFSALCKLLIKKLREKDDYTYYLLKNSRAKCLDYTYKDTDKLTSTKIDYPMFNIDLIWLLENLLYYSLDDQREEMLLKVIYQIQGGLITSFMGSNYKKPVLGRRAIGGNGIAICFPKNEKFRELSIIRKKKLRFYKVSGWSELLSRYYNYKPVQSVQDALTAEGMNSLNFDVDDEKVAVSHDKQRLIFKRLNRRKKVK
jgi:hypothetical protein